MTTTKTPHPISARITARREALGISKRALAEKLGIERQNLIRWEQGRNVPTIGNVEKLADALQCDPGWLAFGPAK